MGLQDFLSQVAQGKGAEAISREANRVSGNVSREVDRVGQSVGREADRVVGGIEDAAAYVRREARRGVDNAAKLGKKVDDAVHNVSNIGKKYVGEVSGVAKKVGTIADVGAAALGGAAALVGASGVGAPIAAGLGAAAGVAKGVGSAADFIGDTGSKINRGLERVENVSRVATKNVMGGISRGAETLNRGLDIAEMKSGATRKGIERVRKSTSGAVPVFLGGSSTR